jgi:hypothetical protein
MGWLDSCSSVVAPVGGAAGVRPTLQCTSRYRCAPQALSCLRVDRSGAYDMRAHFNFLLHLLCPPSTRLTI